jgi:hypothetical protein
MNKNMLLVLTIVVGSCVTVYNVTVMLLFPVQWYVCLFLLMHIFTVNSDLSFRNTCTLSVYGA